MSIHLDTMKKEVTKRTRKNNSKLAATDTTDRSSFPQRVDPILRETTTSNRKPSYETLGPMSK